MPFRRGDIILDFVKTHNQSAAPRALRPPLNTSAIESDARTQRTALAEAEGFSHLLMVEQDGSHPFILHMMNQLDVADSASGRAAWMLDADCRHP